MQTCRKPANVWIFSVWTRKTECICLLWHIKTQTLYYQAASGVTCWWWWISADVSVQFLMCVSPTAALRIRAAGRRDMGGARTLHVRNDDRWRMGFPVNTRSSCLCVTINHDDLWLSWALFQTPVSCCRRETHQSAASDAVKPRPLLLTVTDVTRPLLLIMYFISLMRYTQAIIF